MSCTIVVVAAAMCVIIISNFVDITVGIKKERNVIALQKTTVIYSAYYTSTTQNYKCYVLHNTTDRTTQNYRLYYASYMYYRQLLAHATLGTQTRLSKLYTKLTPCCSYVQTRAYKLRSDAKEW